MFFILLYVPKALFSQCMFASHLLLVWCSSDYSGRCWKYKKQDSSSSGESTVSLYRRIPDFFFGWNGFSYRAFRAQGISQDGVFPAKWQQRTALVPGGCLIKADNMAHDESYFNIDSLNKQQVCNDCWSGSGFALIGLMTHLGHCLFGSCFGINAKKTKSTAG